MAAKPTCRAGPVNTNPGSPQPPLWPPTKTARGRLGRHKTPSFGGAATGRARLFQLYPKMSHDYGNDPKPAPQRGPRKKLTFQYFNRRPSAT